MGKKDNACGSWRDADDLKSSSQAGDSRCQSCCRCRRRRGRGGRERRGRRRGPPGLPRRTPDERKMYSTPLVVLCVFSVLTLQVKKKIVIIQLLFIIFIISKSPCPSPDEVVSTLGAGAFGKVVECLDRDKDERVAVKILRNIECFRDAARSEVAVLEEINSLDDDNRFACVRMLDWFDHEGHICIVLQLLGLSTFEFLRLNEFLPFGVEQIRHMAFQIFRAVCFLHRNKLTHTDLKPENILFICSDYDHEYNPETECEEKKLRSLDVKVVDFGTATFDHEHHKSLVSTRHYRAPEVILDLGWNQSCDVWSLGCVLMEFYLGHALFQTHDSGEHLAMMERILGPIPLHLLKQTRKQRYVHNGRLAWDLQTSSDDHVGRHCRPLKVKRAADRPRPASQRQRAEGDFLSQKYMRGRSEEERQMFDLLGYMLEYDVCRRITLEEALWHPFFSPPGGKKPL
ncbi:dual specificity protein kinase CLK4 isoform X3 [Gasterosteus aculeatus]